MVSQFPLESMHLIDLEVTKKLLKLLVNKRNAIGMNEKIGFIGQYVLSEFCVTHKSFMKTVIGNPLNLGNFYYTQVFIF